MKKVQKITPRKLKSIIGVNFLLISEKADFPDPLRIKKNETIIVVIPFKCRVTFVAHDIFDDIILSPGFYKLIPKKDQTGTATYAVSAPSRRKKRVRTSHSITVGS